VNPKPRQLVAIVGATATGKSEVAVALAEALAGEVVGADAYQVYRGMDIGTAKAEPSLRARAPHHLIDVCDPSQPMTLAVYLEQAAAALEAIWRRGRLPVLAGGSGQYVWALLEGWEVPRVAPDPSLRAQLEALAASGGAAALASRLATLDPDAASRIDTANNRRLIRAIEVVSATGRPLAACQTRSPIDADVLVIGLHLSREALYARLDARTESMYASGFVQEVEALRARGYGDTPAVRGGVGYKEASAYLDGAYDLEEAIRRHKNANHRLVRRQAAWFKPTDARIRWLEADEASPARAVEATRTWLEALSN
jgi:tRNA dimethylallyltransferase